MMIRLIVIASFLSLHVLPSVGCSRNLRKELSRGTSPQLPSALSRDLAHQAPVNAPQPPLPPPLPGEPILAPPQSNAITGNIPVLPNGGPVVPMTVTPAVAEEFISTADTDDRKPLRERVEENRKKREDRRTDTKPEPPAKAETPAKSDAATKETSTDLGAVKKLLNTSLKRYAEVTDYECRLIKREVVASKQLPTDEILYRFRKEPLSVYMKTLSDAGQGREVMFVKGQFGEKMHVITGKGDNLIVGVGYKTEVDPDSKMATAKSRYRVYEAGFGRTLADLTKAVNSMEAGSGAVKALGLVSRKEFEYTLEAVDVTLKPGDDPLLDKGGKRQLFFDPKPDSPSYMLPVLVITTDAAGKEVEYYCFDRLKTPTGLKDMDWHPAMLGKKK